MKNAIYIGENAVSIANFSHYWGESLLIANYNEQAKNILLSEPDKYKYILFEKINTERDLICIAELKNQYKNSYFILVTNALDKKDISAYLKAGISNTIAPSADKKTIEKMIALADKSQIEDYNQTKNANQLTSFRMPLSKRIFDIVMASLALIILSPILIITAICIRMESKGPVIYKSKRVGSNYKIFDFIKFRSMYPDADKRLKDYMSLNQYVQNKEQAEKSNDCFENENTQIEQNETLLIADDYTISETEYMNKRHFTQENAFVKYEHDPRITNVGRIIRKYSIDELPQLINILKGDMSFVGNRPLPLYEAEMLTTDNYIDRFLAPAGLTGLWQVERRGDASSMSAEERKHLDIYYAQHHSFWYDIKLIFRTFTSFIQKDDV